VYGSSFVSGIAKINYRGYPKTVVTILEHYVLYLVHAKWLPNMIAKYFCGCCYFCFHY